ncbi:MAG: prohibitin family protein [Haliscomenobacter sp.]|uniref:prohibitin family protein n=1 Tax=Haliscomenobacter sp. TaxID=2717303 RepID=UPI0029A0205C|nr:prohibitin family protein [Haliscomenobacter sp.]MDX2072348.1 prohibitin family protein [Haliscomenobacter sp.]
MTKYINQILIFLVVLSFATSCTVVRQGEVGVRRTLGKYNDRPIKDGVRFFNPFVTTVIKVPTQTVNLEVSLNIPSKEGLTIQSEVSILYNVQGGKAAEMLRQIGPEYERNLILPVFRSAVADISSRFFAKDMHTGERAQIEEQIRILMDKTLDEKGIEVEAVLLKSIQLPKSLARAIEEKLEAEQGAQRMEFVLQQEQREAERKRIQAQGVRDAQNIISQGLTQEVLQFKAIEAFLELAKSPNAKIVITDGKQMPLMMDASSNTPGVNTLNRSGISTTTTTVPRAAANSSIGEGGNN